MVKRSESNKKEFLKSQGYKSIPYGYQIDHITPLSEGGSDDPSNMQLLTISQHKEKTARERTKRSTSNYLATKPNYQSSITTNQYGEQISYATYSRTDFDGKIIYISKNGKEFFFNENERKVYVKSSSNISKSEYKIPTIKNTDYNYNTTETIQSTRSYESSSIPSSSTQTLPTSTTREIHTGPRGGQYYINSNGNKTYVPR
ncbi:HNH endonuclease [Flavobacterium amniphilum]|uniref:HNH endonuclease signature motif containing protein n=1 Tax=Flavobacterium amniphilum TaxID=1834035 RepID=UPI00202A2394|nr:HNH endonuclease signature motif containing protein [Flavobacterium amniphilum]MCL9805386.1 HNH endonuclease [Flavobacterium amniphilum]